ncbi:hypothetical protein FDP41_002434 [Naegleria fowleri]|uniref:Uncharacterized protein n=1 Tax=Naegleria fowleri TaxID=5763 RepID=A0A6A5BWD8_NAEFO|nr:uncharacterized protein FDP41_002434 [Naegleria fowleri]KAF0978614.1 hypothetical protein FDP41_002434 [Naegleria fowleri]CAG4710445.1 unnamed protein product [Naegleria fowleri]
MESFWDQVEITEDQMNTFRRLHAIINNQYCEQRENLSIEEMQDWDNYCLSKLSNTDTLFNTIRFLATQDFEKFRFVYFMIREVLKEVDRKQKEIDELQKENLELKAKVSMKEQFVQLLSTTATNCTSTSQENTAAPKIVLSPSSEPPSLITTSVESPQNILVLSNPSVFVTSSAADNTLLTAANAANAINPSINTCSVSTCSDSNVSEASHTNPGEVSNESKPTELMPDVSLSPSADQSPPVPKPQRRLSIIIL